MLFGLRLSDCVKKGLGLKLDRFTEICDCEITFALCLMNSAALEIGLDVARIELEGTVERLKRMVDVPGLHKDQPACSERRGKFRIKQERMIDVG
jgi:hypothetical protein